MLLLLVRHGLTEATRTRLVGRLPGFELSTKGHAQAAEAARRLAVLPVAAVYSSPLERALQTAAPLCERTGITAAVEPGLLEMDYGEWAGQEYKALARTDLWKLVQQRPSAVRFPGGEEIREGQARVVATVEALAERHRDEVVVAFSHADPIRLAVAHFTGIHLDLYQRLSVTPASVTALHLGGGPPVLLRLSDSGTLDELKPPRRRRRQN